jgi:phospholipid/cholesterol/gamma-HCH transport system permease protein
LSTDDKDHEETQVRAAPSPAGTAGDPPTPSSAGPQPPAVTGPPGATPPPPDGEPKMTVAGAVWTGVKDAGKPVHNFLDVIGAHLIMVGRALAWLPRRPFRGRNYLEAMEYIGFGSLPIILLVGVFTGAVTSLQSVNAFRVFGFESFSGGATGKALSIELGPVLTSLMLAGRVSTGIATELGTMRITEQIDALESMAVNPYQFLILPRLIGGVVVTPILALIFFVVGMGGAYIVAVLVEGVPQGPWIANLREIVEARDVVQGCLKAIVFGFMITLIGSYQGFHATGGGRGVGIGTARAVVIASVATLVLDYFLTDILFHIMPSARGQW